MSDYQISPVYPGDTRTLADVKALLQQEGIRLDPHVDYTCVMYDEEYHAIATGSCFGNTLRCLAVSHDHQGESLMNEIVSHLIQYEYDRGIIHLFLYTKCSSVLFLEIWVSMKLPGCQIRLFLWKRTRMALPAIWITWREKDAPRAHCCYCNECQSLYLGTPLFGGAGL